MKIQLNYYIAIIVYFIPPVVFARGGRGSEGDFYILLSVGILFGVGYLCSYFEKEVRSIIEYLGGLCIICGGAYFISGILSSIGFFDNDSVIGFSVCLVIVFFVWTGRRGSS